MPEPSEEEKEQEVKAGEKEKKQPPKEGEKPDPLEAYIKNQDERFSKLEQAVNLLSANILSPDFQERREKPPAKEPTEPKKGKSFDEYQWNEMDNRELAATMATELNTVIGKLDENYKEELKNRDETIEDLRTELDITRTVGRIAMEEDISLKEANKLFEAQTDAMLELTEKYPTIDSWDAYCIATGKATKPPPKEGGKSGVDMKELAKQLRGGGGKPGGATDLDTTTPKTTQEVLSRKYDELFGGKET